jgi:hypothetical protein
MLQKLIGYRTCCNVHEKAEGARAVPRAIWRRGQGHAGAGVDVKCKRECLDIRTLAIPNKEPVDLYKHECTTDKFH